MRLRLARIGLDWVKLDLVQGVRLGWVRLENRARVVVVVGIVPVGGVLDLLCEYQQF